MITNGYAGRCLTILLALVAAPQVYAQPETSPISVQQAGQGRALLDLSSRPVRLSDYRGKVLLVNFWTSWCPPCIREIPALEALARELDANNAAILMINVEEPSGVLRRFKRLDASGIVVLRDPKGQVKRDWRVEHYPTSFLVDADGAVHERIDGPAQWDDGSWLERIRALVRAQGR